MKWAGRPTCLPLRLGYGCNAAPLDRRESKWGEVAVGVECLVDPVFDGAGSDAEPPSAPPLPTRTRLSSLVLTCVQYAGVDPARLHQVSQSGVVEVPEDLLAYDP